MRIVDLIEKKKHGESHSKEEIDFLISSMMNGNAPDYQISAWLMAVYFKGLIDEETAYLTDAMVKSGDVVDFGDLTDHIVDKHSTGGVGDKVTITLIPLLAAAGVPIAKLSGKGLGHTGGTIDKLESIPGFNTSLETDEFIKNVNEIGVCIVGQSHDLAPADKKLYALRDVTATIDSLPLVVSSIMGKKLAADDDCIVLDVKTGSGAFTKTLEDSRELARVMVDIGKRAGKKMLALITDMDRPLGNAIGNSLEVIEAIDTLNGHGPADFTEICLILASNMLSLAGKGSVEECRARCEKALHDGSALETFAKMVKAQGGDVGVVYDPDKFPKAKYSFEVKIKKSGYIAGVDTEGYGRSSLLLGAGRNTKDDAIDFSAGIILKKKTGDYVENGETVAVMYSSDEAKFEDANKLFLASTLIMPDKPQSRPLVLDRVE